MITSTNMGLTIWNSTDDAYDHAQLANNLLAIDVHDHTSGKGVQIPAAGLASDSVTTVKVLNAAITGAKIASDTITPDKLTFGIAKVGDVQMVWRPSDATSLQPWYDDGWALANGQVIQDEDHDFSGGGVIRLPDMQGKFPAGATLTGGTANLPNAPAPGQSGGSNTLDLSHTHTLDAADITYTNRDPYAPFLYGGGYGYGWGYGYGLHAIGKTSNSLSTLQDNRPAFTGFIFLIKVKN